jgi:glutamate dehydrogenase (NADP+)
MSDSLGYVVDEEGIDLHTIKLVKEVERKGCKEYTAQHRRASYNEGCASIWDVPCHVALPCATQNELDERAAQTLIANGCIAVAEGANMPCTPEAVELFLNNKILFAPAKAANAGGVAVSALEMSQNSMRYTWTFEEVDMRLKNIMIDIYKKSCQAARQYGHEGNLVVGANIAGFLKVADAMIAQGIV